MLDLDISDSASQQPAIGLDTTSDPTTRPPDVTPAFMLAAARWKLMRQFSQTSALQV